MRFTELISGPTVAGATAFILLVITRIPAVNRRVARLLDPVVRWWTRGALTDQVAEREREILFRRTQDVDILEAYQDEIARWAVEVRAIAIEHDITIPRMKTFRQFKAEWLRDHPEYANEFGKHTP
ncbi:iron dependent repressor [Mycolicibacterium canariasense]|uniref:Iron dependent repressor n=1 Tax=Mycolicibacterium canariasense TaxID=228230 RepID=A0A117IC34_MYCCR|nr:hypothetical protein [Mycolicibacterium canariasense]MCV7210525.1 hypothetical protein [Mycolicibacterium canariasense]ORU96138.1 hypothetical protein AWB94_31230 [Mycolicibacterium canariasense]GAS98914.1 iron dependent repressor [Mycolicibacterium canariasense]